MNTVLLFLNLGGGEIFIILLVVLLMFGGKGVPTMAKTLGKSIREFKDAANGIQRDFQNSAQEIHRETNQQTTVVKEEVQELTSTPINQKENEV
jgi:sec-independent protein translocase protein TatA